MAGRVRMDTSGPWFRRDPRKTFRENVRAMLDEMAEYGAEKTRAGIPAPTGDLRGGVIGRTKSLRGRRWALSAVVTPTWVEPWRSPQPAGAKYRGGKLRARTRAFKSASYAVRAKTKRDLAKGMT